MGGVVAFLAVMAGKLPKRLVFAAVGALAGAAAIFGVYAYGRHEGRQQAAVSATRAIAQAYKDRSHENATVDALGPIRLCVALGASLHDCEAKLRGLGEDHGAPTDGGVHRRP